MDKSKIQATAYQVYQLMAAAQGNILNCTYIDCAACKHGRDNCTSGGDFVYAALGNGSPVLLSVSDVLLLSGVLQAKPDYLSVISHTGFCTIYFLFIQDNVPPDCNKCPILALFEGQKAFAEKLC